MVREAVDLTVDDDLTKGRDPRSRRAPEEEWTDLWACLRRSRGAAVEEALQLEEPEFLIFEGTLYPDSDRLDLKVAFVPQELP